MGMMPGTHDLRPGRRRRLADQERDQEVPRRVRGLHQADQSRRAGWSPTPSPPCQIVGSPLMPSHVIVDGQEIEIGADERLNCIEAARRAGKEIPHYCWHPGLSVVASCRMCLIETGHARRRHRQDHDGAEARAGLPDAGQGRHGDRHREPAREGRAGPASRRRCSSTTRSTARSATRRASACCRTTTSSTARPSGGPTCIPSRAASATSGPTVTLFVDRCIMCTRCVRFTREVSGTSELMVTSRGAKEEIDVFPGLPARQQALRQRGRPLPGGGARRQGLPLPAAGLVPEARGERLRRLLGRLLDPHRAQPGHGLPAQAPRESRTSTSGGCATRAATAGTTSTIRRGCSTPAAAARRAARPRCGRRRLRGGRVGRRGDEAPRRPQGRRPAGRGRLADAHGRRGLDALRGRPVDRPAGVPAPSATCPSSVPTRRSRAGSRSAPRNARIARGVEAVVALFDPAVPLVGRPAWPTSRAGKADAAWITAGYPRARGSTTRRPPTFAEPRATSSCRISSIRRWRSSPPGGCPPRASPSGRAPG